VTSFQQMTEQIATVKEDAAKQRLEQLNSDLATLKDADPQEYQRLRESLRSTLDLD
jgi:hypothetical protein